MKVTVTTTSTSLKDLLSTSDLDLVKKRCGATDKITPYMFFLQVLGANDVYLEYYKDATVAESAKIANTSGTMSFALTDLQNANLIADGGSSEVRVLINS
jgi:hypothetical protein